MTLLDADYYPDALPCQNCPHKAKSHDSMGCTEIDCSCPGFSPVPDDGPENAEEAEAERLGLR